jgi:hypothetical protein
MISTYTKDFFVKEKTKDPKPPELEEFFFIANSLIIISTMLPRIYSQEYRRILVFLFLLSYLVALYVAKSG